MTNPQSTIRQFYRSLSRLPIPYFAAMFIAVAVLFSMLITFSIDWLWDGKISAELEFAGIVVPLLVGLLIVGLLLELIAELREEVGRRRAAEANIQALNNELEIKVEVRTRQLLAAQVELVRREKLALLGQVADRVGHELRNPLGVINNAVYYLQSALPQADDNTREYLGIIRDEVGDAERIVSDLLDAVRTKPPHTEEVNVAELLGHALKKCVLPERVILRLDISPTLRRVRVDPTQIFQVFWNLITNAVEAMPEGGKLEIAAADTGQFLRIEFKDSGGGMSVEQQLHLFLPMFTTKPRRVGLGLVVVKNLTEANGGKVEVQSAPGVGSVFAVILPFGSERRRGGAGVAE